tara:strand:+ start:700 stop:1038 length:339 start_codon:yes stop_codon:yes gene_type:complete
MNDAYTEDLTKFGYRELDIAGDLLKAIKKGLPSDFYEEGIKLGFNTYSGNVFLTNEDYQVAMVDDDGKLYSFYSSPYDGLEGSYEDLKEDYDDMHPEDQEWFDDLTKSLNKE